MDIFLFISKCVTNSHGAFVIASSSQTSWLSRCHLSIGRSRSGCECAAVNSYFLQSKGVNYIMVSSCVPRSHYYVTVTDNRLIVYYYGVVNTANDVNGKSIGARDLL